MKISFYFDVNDKLVKRVETIAAPKNVLFMVAVFFFICSLFIFSGELPVPHTFESGDIIYASELNANFEALISRTLGSLSDVNVSGATSEKVLKFDGSQWYAGDDMYGEGVLWSLTAENTIYYTAGNVGIGTTSPAGELHVVGTIISTRNIYSGANYFTTAIGGGYWAGSSNFAVGWFEDGGRLRLRTSFENRITIDQEGNVGIGTESTKSKLSIVGLPTSISGLSSGDIWVDTANGNVLKIIP